MRSHDPPHSAFKPSVFVQPSSMYVKRPYGSKALKIPEPKKAAITRMAAVDQENFLLYQNLTFTPKL